MSAPNGNDNRLTSEIAVPSTDPEKKDDDKPKANGDVKGKGKGEEKEQPDISEEDLQLKAELEMLVERLKEPDTSLYIPALESLRTLIRTSTSSMTSVPKPLKFLRPFYEEMGKIRDGWNKDLKEQRSLLASILSVLAMTYSDTGKRDTLYYRILSESTEAPGLWGHEYVRHLASELGEEWNSYYASLVESTADGPVTNGEKINGLNGTSEEEERKRYSQDQLRSLALELVDFFLKHNGEADAVDLLLELECIKELRGKVDEKTYDRVCRYMVQCVPLLVPPDDRSFLEVAAEIYAQQDRYPEALALAVQINDRELIRRYFDAPTNPVMKKQLAFFLARSLIPISWVHTPEGEESEGEGPCPEQPEDILECLGAVKLSTHFKAFGKAVGVEDPRSPEDIYKLHLEPTRATTVADSAKSNLAATFVNAFVNAGFGNDKLIAGASEGGSWIYKNKDEGMMSASASIGLSMIWDSENGIDQIDKYTYSSEEHIKAGALLAMGILHSSIRPDPDVTFALLEDHIDSKSKNLKTATMNGIAIAYAGSRRKDILEKILPHVTDESSMEISSMAALTLGFVFVGSADGDIASTILQTLMERDPSQLESEWTVFMGLALGLLFLSSQDASEATIETLRAIEHPMAETATCLVDVCSYAGTGNVLKIQDMLHICSEHVGSPKKKESNGDLSENTPPPTELGIPNIPGIPGLTSIPGMPNMGSNMTGIPGIPNSGVSNIPGVGAGSGDINMEDSRGRDNRPRQQPTSSSSIDNSNEEGEGENNASGDEGASGVAAAANGETAENGVSTDANNQQESNENEEEEENASPKSLKHQAVATLGIALIAMGEDIGSEMALRQFQHLMTFGDPTIRQSVPLALGLISASKPQIGILETLSKYSHDSDLIVAQNAILAMGLVGAGTNNARLAQMLRGLGTYYHKEPDTLFMVRIAQGLVHMGKGTIGINPFYHDGQVMSRTAVAGILSVLVAFTDSKSFVLGKHHWMLYWLTTAMYPQFLIALDENLEEKAVTVRVGQAVNTVGLAGTRHGISGFQTHQTPVRIGTGERAELGTNEYFPYASVLENFVILKKNDAYTADE